VPSVATHVAVLQRKRLVHVQLSVEQRLLRGGRGVSDAAVGAERLGRMGESFDLD
jgi:hypothetical protein